MRELWTRWKGADREVIAPWVGLAFAGLYLGAIAAVGVVAVYVHHSELTRQQLSESAVWTRWLARHLAHVASDQPESLAREIVQASREPGIQFCAIIGEDDTFQTHSNPLQVGRPAPDIEWTTDGEQRVQIGAIQGNKSLHFLSSPIVSPLGEATPSRLMIAVEPARLHWKQSDLLMYSGYVLLAVLGLFLLIYQLFRKQVRPLAVIRGRLVGAGDKITDNLCALRLSDSFDQVSGSWNRIIDCVAEMQEQLRRTHLTGDVTSAMDGYRSARLTEILMHIPFGVVVVGNEGIVSFANRAAAGMLGEPGDSLEGKSASDLLDESLRISLLAPQTPRRPSGAQAKWFDHTVKRAHSELVLRFWPVSLGGKKGRPEADTILFVQDVTQVKEAERARDNFLYHVTHELRTPLTNIRAYAETLSQGVIDDEQTVRECYNVIMGETRRLNQLVEDILNVSQLEVGSARLNVGEVHLDELLRKVVQDVQANADEKQIDLVLGIPAKLPRVRGDRDRLAVVFVNLVGNALKYTPPQGRVDVTCAAESGRVRITVTDTGYGIPPEDHDRISEKFYRVDDPRVAESPGTGLGLSIVKETIRLHGGAILVASSEDKGSTFTVLLPAIDLDASAKQTTGAGMVTGDIS